MLHYSERKVATELECQSVTLLWVQKKSSQTAYKATVGITQIIESNYFTGWKFLKQATKHEAQAELNKLK